MDAGINASEAGMSIADMVRQAASEVYHSRVPEGFEWIESYGQYYSRETGFFYDPSTGLFYESASETYYIFDDATQSYQVYRCMQKVNWCCPRYEKQARSHFGDDFNCLGQDSADVVQTVFALVDAVVEGKLEYNAEDWNLENKDYEHLSKAQKRKLRRNRVRQRKRKGIYTEDPNLIVYEENKEPCPSGSREGSGEDEYLTPSESGEEQEEDERVKMMEDEGFSQPPLLRVIDEKNRLSVVTICGGVVGTGKGVEVEVGDMDTPKRCLEFCFVQESNSFVVKRISKKGFVSLNDFQLENDEDKELEHGDFIRIGKSLLHIHVHYGNNTCSGCEPGLLQSANPPPASVVPQFVSGETARRRTLKMLKASYGVQDYQPSTSTYTANDRAAKRRRDVGSYREISKSRRQANDNDIHANCMAKPVPGATVPLPVPAATTIGTPSVLSDSNKGFKLLKGMGWKEGEGLGKEAQGRTEPVMNALKTDRSGLGAEEKQTAVLKPSSQKDAILDITRKRYEQIANTGK